MQHFRLWALTLIPWTQELCGFCGFRAAVPGKVKKKSNAATELSPTT